MLTSLEHAEAFHSSAVHLPLERADPELIRRRIKSQRAYTLVKRCFDIVVVVLAAPAAVPVLLLAMIAVWMWSGAPIFFLQSRVGLNGRTFRLVKLRTMHATESQVPCATAANDTRITPVGSFLRKSHIDELPQLWNILRGDMSLIGPRPEQASLVASYREVIPHYDLRHLIKPGLSGWSQVFFGYAMDAQETRAKLEYDLYYLENFGPEADLVVFFRTLWIYLSPNYAR